MAIVLTLPDLPCVGLGFRFWGIWGFTHGLHSSSFLGLPYRIRNMNHKKELLWSLWVGLIGLRK